MVRWLRVSGLPFKFAQKAHPLKTSFFVVTVSHRFSCLGRAKTTSRRGVWVLYPQEIVVAPWQRESIVPVALVFQVDGGLQLHVDCRAHGPASANLQVDAVTIVVWLQSDVASAGGDSSRIDAGEFLFLVARAQKRVGHCSAVLGAEWPRC